MKSGYSAMCSAFLLVLLLFFGPKAVAFEPALADCWKKETSDGSRVLVMIPHSFKQNKGNKCTNVSSLISQSGLYPVDDYRNPIWTIDHFSTKVHLLNNGDRLISSPNLYPRIGCPIGNRQALLFFEQGKKVKSYKVNDLILFPSLFNQRHSWKISEGVDRKRSVFWVKTRSYNYYEFSTQTGEILTAYRIEYWVFYILSLLFISTVIIFSYKKIWGGIDVA